MSGAAKSPARQAVAAPALRGLRRFALARGIPAGAEFLLDYDVIEAFCVAGLAGRARSTRGTYRSALYRLAAPVHGEPGQRGHRLRGPSRRPRTRRPSGQSWPPSQPPSVTRPSAVQRWPWWCSASAPGCGPGNWRRCAAATSPAAAAMWSSASPAAGRGWYPSPHAMPGGRPNWRAARVTVRVRRAGPPEL